MRLRKILYLCIRSQKRVILLGKFKQIFTDKCSCDPMSKLKIFNIDDHENLSKYFISLVQLILPLRNIITVLIIYINKEHIFKNILHK